MQRRTLGTREELEGILEDAATSRGQERSRVTMAMTSSVFCCPVTNARMRWATRRSSAISSTRSRSRMIWNWCAARPEARWIM